MFDGFILCMFTNKQKGKMYSKFYLGSSKTFQQFWTYISNNKHMMRNKTKKKIILFQWIETKAAMSNVNEHKPFDRIQPSAVFFDNYSHLNFLIDIVPKNKNKISHFKRIVYSACWLSIKHHRMNEKNKRNSNTSI